jgi:hypothetical protein
MNKSGAFDKFEVTKKRNSPTMQIMNMPLNKKEKRDSQNFNFSYMKSE